MKTDSSRRVKDTGPARRDGDGNYIYNKLLLNLPVKEFDEIVSTLELVRLKHHQVLYEVGETIKSAYFCNSGMLSVLTILPCGESVEVGLVGKEGFVGIPLIAGFRTSHTRTVVQVESTVFRIDAARFKAALRRLPGLELQVQRYGQVAALQVTQIAACNRLHEVEQRLARWLLMSQDRLASDSLPLTQDFLAQMLGTRRSSVSLAAGILQKAGLIRLARGGLTILDRRGLEEASCDCYEQLQRQTREWLSQNS